MLEKYSIVMNRLSWCGFSFMEKWSREQSPYTPVPAPHTFPVSHILHQGGAFVTIDEPMRYIIIYRSP